MKFLIDIQLPPRLKSWFVEKNQDAIHASDLPNGLTLADADIWRIAKELSFIIVTKDIDFYDMSMLYGKPPVVLLIRYGNCSNKALLLHIENTWHRTKEALRKSAVSMVVLHPERIDTYKVDNS